MVNSSLSEYEIEEIVRELKDKITDQKFLENYGSSSQFTMGNNYEEILKKEFSRLYEEFKKIDTNNNDYIDNQELADFVVELNRKNNSNFQIDDDYIDNIFRVLDMNMDGKISV